MPKGWRGDPEGHAKAGRKGGAVSRRFSTRLNDQRSPMAKVWYDAKTKEYKHENGRSIPVADLRTLPHHRKAIEAMVTKTYDGHGDELTVPAADYPQAEVTYVEKILSAE